MLATIFELLLYMMCVALAMYGLMAFNYDGVLKKGRTKEFYVFYLLASLSLGYLAAQFILTFITIRL